jgi:hypothetical protein
LLVLALGYVMTKREIYIPNSVRPG